MPDPSSSLSFPGPSRSNSSASTASSTASISHRPRATRQRTRTITAASHRDEKSARVADQVLDISPTFSVDAALHPIVGNPEIPHGASTTLPRPAPAVALVSDVRNGSSADRRRSTFGSFAPLMDDHEVPPESVPLHFSQSQTGIVPSSEIVASTPAVKGKARHPVRLTSPPSSFKPTPTDDRIRSRLRDSLLTQQSSTSSSVYPMSTSMGTESPPSPLSPVLPNRAIPIPTAESDGPKIQEFDADDVSYRLQLLVKNNYFLPPAHAKPSPADFLPVMGNSKKTPSPTFLDLFRVGKPKSKPSSPDAPNGTSPIFRVTSDSTTASGQISRDGGRPSPQAFRPPPGSQHMARVVVVREKMDDLAAAARQAEKNIGRHDFLLDRDRASRRAKFTTFDGIVDPTEAVDVPPPSANYPLALQASALHGLGIEDSVGAAILAEWLPPPGTPGQSSLDPREDAWRKALLREAVGHSLNNSRATFSASRASTPTRSPFRAQSSDSLRPDRGTEQQRRLLDQKIIRHPIIDPLEDAVSPAPPATSVLNPPATVREPDLRRLSNLALLRVETPVPHTPLSPPPRRPYGTTFSQSQTNVVDSAACQTPKKLLRKSLSSPMLSEKHERKTNGSVTPSKSPPVPTFGPSPVPSSFDKRMSRATSTSRYTSSELDDQVVDDHPGRPSLALTLQSTDGRASISEHSQPSPTASAFRDRWSDGYYSANSVGPGESSDDPANSPVFNQNPRPPTMSPPPRSSSSVAHFALSPPPRTRYVPLQSTSSRIFAVPSTRTSSQATVHSFASNSTTSQSVYTPSPLVNASSQSFHSALHSAPPPSSTAEFFDHVQAHADTMIELDDSDDSASETDQDVTAVYSASPQRLKLMRLGNLSTPNVYPGANEPYYPSVNPNDRRKPVGHMAPRNPYFSSLKGAHDSLTHLSLAQRSREHLIPLESSPDFRPASAGTESVRRWQKEQEVFQESSRRLDGLLLQHMQAEKDTLKRIAETAKVAK